MKRIAIFIAVILLISSLALPAMAANEDDIDVTYSGMLDPTTGLAPEDSSEYDDAQPELVLANGVGYDAESGMYTYSVQGYTQTVKSDIMTGMITTGKVCIILPDGISAELYRDGEPVTDQDISEITRKGSYVLNTTSADSVRQVMTFTIINEVTGKLDYYKMPSGFAVQELYRDGQPVSFELTGVDMTAEGKYRIVYGSYDLNKQYVLDVTVDHTAPVMALEAVNEENIANGPVDISDLEDGATITVMRNNKRINYSNTLKEAGNYKLVITDEAGNTTTYFFTIQVYLNTNSVIFFILVFILIAAFIYYILRSRKKLRVR